MIGILDLFASPIEPPFVACPVTQLEVRYARWYRNNPGQFAMLEREALRQARETKRLSIAKLFEELRTQSKARGEPYAWNNSYRAPAVDHLVWKHPDELREKFETRRRTSHLKKERAVA